VQLELIVHEQPVEEAREMAAGAVTMICDPETRALTDVKAIDRVEVTPMEGSDRATEAVDIVEVVEVTETLLWSTE
jgi:hypothetical protein